MTRLFLALLCGLGCALPPAVAEEPPAITVFGAASLTNALQDIGDAFTKESSVTVRFSFAASSALARQIETGAPADLFVSADVDWMDYLERRGLIQPASRHDLVGNRLVLIAEATSTIDLTIGEHFPLGAALGKGRLAIGEPGSVPAGRYAKQALTRLGVWSDVADRLIGAESVRAALLYVDRGEAPLGIVYLTDANVDKNVRIVGEFPANSHSPIVYPAALLRSAKPPAGRFLEFLESPTAAVVFRAYGFTPLH